MPNPKTMPPWTCPKCGEKVTISYFRHRKVCRKRSAPAVARSGQQVPKTPRQLVTVLVQAAENLGEAKALAAVEEATGEVLRRSQEMRLELIKSRRINQHLRHRLERQSGYDAKAEAKALEKLDREEKTRARAQKFSGP